MFNPSRDQVRQFFFDVWRKSHAGQPLAPLERLALEVVHAHPEYHVVLQDPERSRDRDYLPEMGETNPFLHMSLHLAILEQLSIDQPPGIAAVYRALLQQHGDVQAAQHDLMDCLAETIWQAQRTRSAPDAEAYLACMRRKAGLPEKSR